MAFAKAYNVDDIETEETMSEPWSQGMKEYLQNALCDSDRLKKFSQKTLDFIQAELKRGEEEVKVERHRHKKIFPIIVRPELEITDGFTGFKYDNVDDFMESLGARCTITCTPCGVEAHSLDAIIAHLEAHHWTPKAGYEEIVFERGAAMEPESEAYYNRAQQRRDEIEAKYPNARFYDDVDLIVVKNRGKKKKTCFGDEREHNPLCAGWVTRLKALRKKGDVY